MRKVITTITLCSIIFSTSIVYGQNKQVDLEKKLTENRNSQLRLDEQIIELNSKIIEVEEKILSTNEEISKLDLQINEIKSEINELENNIQNNKDKLSKRIKVINSNYSMSYIKILLNSSSISDFFNNIYIVRQIVKQDKEVLTELDENKQEFARGIVNYDSDSCKKVIGRHSDNIAEILGFKNYDAIITRDNITIL